MTTLAFGSGFPGPKPPAKWTADTRVMFPRPYAGNPNCRLNFTGSRKPLAPSRGPKRRDLKCTPRAFRVSGTDLSARDNGIMSEHHAPAIAVMGENLTMARGHPEAAGLDGFGKRT